MNEPGFGQTNRATVVARLREEILTGRIPSGTRLRQAEVAERFGISTTPVREAFRELATIGLVAIFPHRGALVLQPTGKDLQSIYEVRQLLEPISVAWAAELITKPELTKATRLVRKMQHTRSTDDVIALNRQFHSTLAHACGNPHLAEVVINLLDLSTPYIGRVSSQRQSRTARQGAEHEEILAALEQGDPERAYAASRHHLTQLHLDADQGGPELPLNSSLAQRWLPFRLDVLPADPPRSARRVGH